MPLAGSAAGLRALEQYADPLLGTDPMPVFFFGHGSPMNAIELNEFSKEWERIGQTLPRPNAILCISAHWLTRGTLVTAMEKPPTIHDFGGFPDELFAVQYPAPGSPQLAKDAAALLPGAGLDEAWGLDHGCWSVVKHLYPDADVPVIQMSIDYHQPGQYHYDLARRLAVLRRKGILIIGSGNMVHNLRMVAWDKMDQPGFAFDWATEANEQMKRWITSRDHRPLIDFTRQGKAFDLAIPTPDHYFPMLYALALQEDKDELQFFNDKAVMGSLTMTSFRIGRD
ncbi:4,5-DOPA-extradiol-dioxygenase [Taibaiella helva]|uniref:4,5-DOPA-extradiol-dioxygenase n=1 Tax=Taibaiella helva TaxID=2301235 RepID=UPI001E4225C7|nr:4,5-DOPA dioxygenase extradiol [Taibaiella helva]